ncbi:MAG: hypothetical protein ABI237_05865 [Ginsengibacter sp.]
MFKDLLIPLLEIVIKNTAKTASDIALEMGYKKNYISEMLSPKGKVTEKFFNSFKLRYKEILENPNQNSKKNNEIEGLYPNFLGEYEQPYKIKIKNNDLEKDIEKEFLRKRVHDLEKIVSLQENLLKSKKRNEDSEAGERTG